MNFFCCIRVSRRRALRTDHNLPWSQTRATEAAPRLRETNRPQIRTRGSGEAQTKFTTITLNTSPSDQGDPPMVALVEAMRTSKSKERNKPPPWRDHEELQVESSLQTVEPHCGISSVLGLGWQYSP